MLNPLAGFGLSVSLAERLCVTVLQRLVRKPPTARPSGACCVTRSLRSLRYLLRPGGIDRPAPFSPARPQPHASPADSLAPLAHPPPEQALACSHSLPSVARENLARYRRGRSRLARASSRWLPLALLAGTTARARLAGSASRRVRDATTGSVSKSERGAERAVRAPGPSQRGLSGC